MRSRTEYSANSCVSSHSDTQTKISRNIRQSYFNITRQVQLGGGADGMGHLALGGFF